MKCPRCGAKCSTKDKFCTSCGCELSTKEKNSSSRKMMIIAAAGLAAFGLTAGGVMVWNKTAGNKDEYSQAIASARKYIDQSDYDKAEELLLYAKSIDPKKTEPYEQLYEVYYYTGDDEQAQNVLDEAQDNLTPEQNEQLEDSIVSLSPDGSNLRPIQDRNDPLTKAFEALDDDDEDSAISYLDEAIRQDPSNPEPYAVLHDLYERQGDRDKANEVLYDAKDNLDEKDYQNLLDQTGIAEEVNRKPEPIAAQRPKQASWKEMARLGKLDMTPIDLGNNGWLLCKNGSFSFLKPDGKIQKADGSAACELILAEKAEGKANSIASAVLTKKTGTSGWKITKSLKKADGVKLENTPVVSLYALDENDQLTVVESESEKADTEKTETASPDVPILIRRLETNGTAVKNGQSPSSADKYWIYNPVGKELYGPYKQKEAASFSGMAESLENLAILPAGQEAVSPFWARQKDGGITVYSADGKKCRVDVKKAMIAGPSSIGIRTGDGFELLDENLETQYCGQFAAGARMISSIAPVKINDEWVLADFRKEKDKDGLSDAKKPADDVSDSASESQQKPSENPDAANEGAKPDDSTASPDSQEQVQEVPSIAEELCDVWHADGLLTGEMNGNPSISLTMDFGSMINHSNALILSEDGTYDFSIGFYYQYGQWYVDEQTGELTLEAANEDAFFDTVAAKVYGEPGDRMLVLEPKEGSFISYNLYCSRSL